MYFDPKSQIAIIWSIEDVQSVRPDLDDAQAFMVLSACKHHHDCNIGMTWDSIEAEARALYPKSRKEVEGSHTHQE